MWRCLRQQIRNRKGAGIEAGLVVPASEAKVLRRALENLAMILASPERGVEKTVELWIDQAREELASET